MLDAAVYALFDRVRGEAKMMEEEALAAAPGCPRTMTPSPWVAARGRPEQREARRTKENGEGEQDEALKPAVLHDPSELEEPHSTENGSRHREPALPLTIE